MKIVRLTWDHFDVAVQRITAGLAKRPASVFGCPRGGLPLAVALSHHLGVPWTPEVGTETLVVDDVLETGETFRSFAQHDPALLWVWVSKQRNFRGNAVLVDPFAGWLVFPWEDAAKAEADARDFYARRQ